MMQGHDIDTRDLPVKDTRPRLATRTPPGTLIPEQLRTENGHTFKRLEISGTL